MCTILESEKVSFVRLRYAIGCVILLAAFACSGPISDLPGTADTPRGVAQDAGADPQDESMDREEDAQSGGGPGAGASQDAASPTMPEPSCGSDAGVIDVDAGDDAGAGDAQSDAMPAPADGATDGGAEDGAADGGADDAQALVSPLADAAPDAGDDASPRADDAAVEAALPNCPM